MFRKTELMFSSPENLKSPAWNTGQKNFRKIAPKHVQNTFGLFWERFLALLEFWNFFWFFSKIFEGSTIHGTLGETFFSEKMPQNMFKASLDNFVNDFGPFWIFEIFRRLELPWNTGENFFSKKMPQNTFGHLRTILDSFRNLKPSWFFSWIFSEYLPRILSPENRFQIVSVQKTEHIVLSSGIWTHNFESRKSGKGLRILTVAWMQKECLLSIVSDNWTHIFKSRKFEKPCMEHWAKKFGKIAPKHVQNMFGHFLDRFWAFLEIWKLFDFFENFRRPDPPWITGQFIFEEFTPKHVWTLENDFGQF